MTDRLYRSRDERMFAGVAGGVAERFDLDPSLVRVVWVILMFLTGSLFFWLYVVMAIVVPEAPSGADRWAGWTTASEPGSGAVARVGYHGSRWNVCLCLDRSAERNRATAGRRLDCRHRLDPRRRAARRAATRRGPRLRRTTGASSRHRGS